MGLFKRIADSLKGEQAPTHQPEAHPHTGQLDAIDTTGPFPAGSLDLNEGFKPSNTTAAPHELISGPPGPKTVTYTSAEVDINGFNAAVRQHLQPLGARWLADFWEDAEREAEHGITKVNIEGAPVLLQLPGNILAEVDEEGLAAYDLDDPEAILWLVRGAWAELTYDNEEGALVVVGDYESMPNEDHLWEHWTAVDEQAPVNPITIGGTTDFYRREQAWPHYSTPAGEQIPLHYVATFTHDGELYDFFYDFTTNEFLDEAYGSYEQHHYMSAYALLAHDRAMRTLAPWVKLLPLAETELAPLADFQRHAPTRALPLAPLWVQAPEIPEAPHNHFVIEIPSVGETMFGDMGSIYIFSDEGHDFSCVYQCY